MLNVFFESLINKGEDDQGDQSGRDEPSDDDCGQGSLNLSSRTHCKKQGHDPENSGEGRHQDRPDF